MFNPLTSNIGRMAAVGVVAIAVGLALYFVFVQQADTASAEDAVADACAQMERPTNYDVVYTALGTEQVLFKAEDYEIPGELNNAKMVGQVQVSGEDYHLRLNLEGVGQPSEVKFVDGVAYLNDGSGEWFRSESQPVPIVRKCVDLTNFVEVGKEDVGRTSTTRYSAAPVKQDPIFKDARHDFWLDGDNRLIQHIQTSKYKKTDKSAGATVFQSEITLELRFEFSGIGEANVIEAPATYSTR